MVLGGPVRGDAAGLVFFARVDGAATLVDVDPETGRVRAWTAALPTTGASHVHQALPRHLVVFGGVENTKAYVYLPLRPVGPTPRSRSRSTAPAPVPRTTSRWSATGSSTVRAAERR